MALVTYSINRFLGINQSVEESLLDSGYTAFASNMCTDDGSLSVGKGYSKLIQSPVPGTERIDKITLFRHADGNRYLIFCGNKIYVSDGTNWVLGYTFDIPIEKYTFDVCEATISGVNYLLISAGNSYIIKYDGNIFSVFGSRILNSVFETRCMTMYKSRLFIGGKQNFPNRLYWSCLPIDEKNINNFLTENDTPDTEGGYVDVGLFANDPIVAIKALPSCILIFKKHSIYRLYGDRPSNFCLETVSDMTEEFKSCSVASIGDSAYYVTQSGLNIFDGVSTRLSPDALCIKNIMQNADITDSCLVKTNTKLYFNFTSEGQTKLIEYDLLRHTYMLREGFSVHSMLCFNNQMLFVGENRYVYLWNSGNTYDGSAINAYWRTPKTDFGKKSVKKHLKELFFLGNSLNGIMKVKEGFDSFSRESKITMQKDGIVELPLSGEGRIISLTFSNEAGSCFSLRGGVELNIETEGRCL